jgi:hypothetical protein
MKAELEIVRRSPQSQEQPLSPGGERELGVILTDMWQNAEKLLRQELALGLAEIDIRVDRLKQSLLAGVIAGAALYAGFLFLLASAALGLSKVMEPWLATLILGGVALGVGVALATRSEHKAEQAVKPDEHSERTVRAMKEAIK